MKSKTLIYTGFFALFLLLSSCAEVSPHMEIIRTDNAAGFWDGLLHGIIAPVTFIISLFRDDVAIYAYDNAGSWYDFGFLLGLSMSIGGGCKGSCRK